MSKIRKRWSFEEKLEILSTFQKEGIGRTSRQYGVSGTMIYRWQKVFDREGNDGLSGKPQRDKELAIIKLERENRELKAIVAEKELQLRIQEEVIKKNRLLPWRR